MLRSARDIIVSAGRTASLSRRCAPHRRRDYSSLPGGSRDALSLCDGERRHSCGCLSLRGSGAFRPGSQDLPRPREMTGRDPGRFADLLSAALVCTTAALPCIPSEVLVSVVAAPDRAGDTTGAIELLRSARGWPRGRPFVCRVYPSAGFPSNLHAVPASINGGSPRPTRFRIRPERGPDGSLVRRPRLTSFGEGPTAHAVAWPRSLPPVAPDGAAPTERRGQPPERSPASGPAQVAG